MDKKIYITPIAEITVCTNSAIMAASLGNGAVPTNFSFDDAKNAESGIGGNAKSSIWNEEE